MDRNIITIGNVEINWKYAIGEYKANLHSAIPITSFDKVILGVIYHSKSRMINKLDLGKIIGFNIEDKPEDFKYKDDVEYQIFEEALQSLSEYKLIEIYNNILNMPELGALAYENKKKNKSEEKDFTLYFDIETGADNIAKDLFQRINGNMISEESNTVDKDRIYEAIKIQIPEFVNTEKERSIHNIICKNIQYYSVSLPFAIIYDLNEKTYEAICSAHKNADIINEIIGDDQDFQNSIISKFFEQEEESIIYKSSVQKKYEESIIKGSNNLFLAKKDTFIRSLLRDVSSSSPLMCFFYEDINENIKQQFVLLSKKNRDKMICIEYIKENATEFIEDNPNIFFEHKESLTTNETCICYDGTYYKEEFFVFEYNNKEYQIPFIIKSEERRYKIKAVAKSFVENNLKQMMNSFNNLFDPSNISTLSIPKIINYYENIYKLSLDFDVKLNEQEAIIFENKINNTINNYIDYKTKEIIRLSKSEKEILEINLQILANFCEIYKENILPNVKTLLNKIKPKQVQIIKRGAYIIDTNIFENNPGIISKFDRKDDIIFIPQIIYDELDKHSHEQESERGENARISLKNIKKIQGEAAHFLRIEAITPEMMAKEIPGYDQNKNDYHILTLAKILQKDNQYSSVTVLTGDNALIHTLNNAEIEVRQEK